MNKSIKSGTKSPARPRRGRNKKSVTHDTLPDNKNQFFDVFRHTKLLFAVQDLIPRGPGIYFIMCSREALYIGQTKDLAHRIGQHINLIAAWKGPACVSCIELPESVSRQEREKLEAAFIAYLRPYFNSHIPELTTDKRELIAEYMKHHPLCMGGAA